MVDERTPRDMAGSTSDRGAPSVRADYLRGDPAERGPITRGRLELESRGLRFSAPGAPELRIDLREMEALTVSGRSPYEHPRKSQRGTMRVAARRNDAVDVWEFAVERKSGAAMRDRIHRELHARGLRRPPLPFVEQLVGPVPPPGDDPAVVAEEPRDTQRARGFSLRRPRVVLIALAGSALVLAEILVALMLIR